MLLLENHVSGRKVDRRVLATHIDPELVLITCVWSRIGQVARHLIPVSGVGVVVGDEKIGGNAVEGTFNKDMTNDEMTVPDTENRQALEPNA